MKAPKLLTRIAFVPVLVGLSIGSATSLAQEDGVATEKMAQTIRQRLALLPADASTGVTVNVEDGRYVIAGIVDGNEYRQDAVNAIRGIDGLDIDLIDARISH